MSGPRGVKLLQLVLIRMDVKDILLFLFTVKFRVVRFLTSRNQCRPRRERDEGESPQGRSPLRAQKKAR